MQRLIIPVLLILMLIGSNAAWYYLNEQNVKETNAKETEYEEELYVEKNEYKILKSENQILNVAEQNRKESIAKGLQTGTALVIPTELNIRQDPSADYEPVGYFYQNANVNIVDVSNPEWFKINLNLANYKVKEIKGWNDYQTKDGAAVFRIKTKFLESGKLKPNIELFLRSKYLGGLQDKYVLSRVPENPQKPFRYGSLFYKEDFAKVMQNELWQKLGELLKQEGYDGIIVERADRTEVVTKMKDEYFDVVETPPLEYVDATFDRERYVPYAKLKTKINESSDYTGIFVVNKNANIKTPKDIKGKKIVFTKPTSASGYSVQKYYLKNKYGYDLEKDTIIVNKKDLFPDSDSEYFEHNEIPLVVAKGFADVGFVGNFVMESDTLEDFQFYLTDKLSPYSAQGVNTPEKLKKYFNENIKTLYILDTQPLTNNPHSIKANLYKNSELVEKLFQVETETYDRYHEEFGLTKSEKGDFSFARELFNFIKSETESKKKSVQDSTKTQKPPTDPITLIGDIKEDWKGKVVTIKGSVTDIKNSKNNSFLSVKDNSGSIKVVIFGNIGYDAVNLKSGSTFIFTGKVDVYKGEVEVIPSTKEDIKKQEP